MREVVLGQNFENFLQDLVADNGLDANVATLKIPSSLVSGTLAMGGGDREALGS